MSVANTQAEPTPLAELYAHVQHDLEQVERCLADQLDSRHQFVNELIRRVRIFHGKRLRPLLLLLCARATGQIHTNHHALAAAIEMIHIATLVHDDVLDDATERRHVATVNAEWGNESSVLLGDFLFSKAFCLAASLDSPLACRVIGDATNRTCEGELHQVSRRRDFDLSESDYFDIVQGKTAELISCACRLGAQYATSQAREIEALANFGRALGIAFQIADDLLDLVASSSQTGKPIGADWAKRKMTLPWIYFRERESEHQVRALRALFESESAAQADAIELLRESDAIELARQKACQFAEQAATELSVLPHSSPTEPLLRITRFVTDRAF